MTKYQNYASTWPALAASAAILAAALTTGPAAAQTVYFARVKLQASTSASASATPTVCGTTAYDKDSRIGPGASYVGTSPATSSAQAIQFCQSSPLPAGQPYGMCRWYSSADNGVRDTVLLYSSPAPIDFTSGRPATSAALTYSCNTR